MRTRKEIKEEIKNINPYETSLEFIHLHVADSILEVLLDIRDLITKK